MSSRRKVQPKGKRLVSAAEPKDSPLRMECRTCFTRPGEKCMNAAGAGITYINDSRQRDFATLIAEEQKLEQWNKLYGSQGER